MATLGFCLGGVGEVSSAGGEWERSGLLGFGVGGVYGWGILSYFVFVVTAGDHVLGIQKIRPWEDHSQHFLQVLNPETVLFCKRQALCNGLDHVDDEDIANELEKGGFAVLLVAIVDDCSANAEKHHFWSVQGIRRKQPRQTHTPTQ